jgi:hypothetical protein
VKLDRGVLCGPGLHDLASAEGISTVDQVDLSSEPGQEECFFQGAVPAADHRHFLAAEEEAVTGRAGADAMASQARLAVDAEPESLGTGGHDTGLGPIFHARRPEPERPAAQVDTIDISVNDARSESFRLPAEKVHQLRTADPVREAGVVLDFAGDHQLSAAGHAADHHRLQVRPGGVDRRGQAGRP